MAKKTVKKRAKTSRSISKSKTARTTTDLDLSLEIALLREEVASLRAMIQANVTTVTAPPDIAVVTRDITAPPITAITALDPSIPTSRTAETSRIALATGPTRGVLSAEALLRDECPPFSLKPIPLPDDPSDGFIPVPGHENFAGGGYADKARTRPAGLFGFAAKLHDFGYYRNDLSFFRGPRCKLELSRFAKMDYIFLQLNKKVWNELTGPARFSDWLASLNFKGKISNFRADDGFDNILNDTILDNPSDYLMIPFIFLPPDQQKKDYYTHRTETWNGGRRIIGDWVTDLIPDYNHLTDYDRNRFWRDWAKEKYTAGLWDKLCSINSSTKEDFSLT